MMQLEPLEREPGWLTHAVDQYATKLRNVGIGQAPAEIVMVILNEPPDYLNDTAREKHLNSCDRCNVAGDFFGNVERTVDGKRVVFTFGACTECLELP